MSYNKKHWIENWWAPTYRKIKIDELTDLFDWNSLSKTTAITEKLCDGNNLNGTSQIKDIRFLSCDLFNTFSNLETLLTFEKCEFENCSLEGSIWKRVKFRECKFTNVNFNVVTFDECEFIKCNFVNIHISSNYLKFINTSIDSRAFLDAAYTNVNIEEIAPH